MAKSNINARTELENRIRFETLISDISARFVRLPSEEVDSEIERALKQILDYFGVDRCGLLGIHKEKGFFYVTHGSYAEGIERVSHETDSKELFPWAYDILINKGLPLQVSQMTQLPPEAKQDRLSWSAMGVKSGLTIPLFSTGGIRHLMVIHSVREERDWPQEYVSRLRLLGEIFVNALERRDADQAIRKSEFLLYLAAESAGVGLWMLNVDSGRFWLTDKARELFDFPLDVEITLDTFLGIVHPDDRERIRQAVDQSRQSKKETSVEYRILRSDGSIRWVKSRGRIAGNGSQEPNRLMGVSIDITERKRLQDEVKQAAEQWQATFDMIQELIMVLDCEFRILRFNKATESFFGLPAAQILGRPGHTLMGTSNMPWESCPVLKASKTKEYEESEVYFDKQDVWLLISATPIFDDQGTISGFIYTAKDITERKRAAEKFLQLREEYTHIARVSAMGELTASLAHELKQPLAAIRSNAQSALRFLGVCRRKLTHPLMLDFNNNMM